MLEQYFAGKRLQRCYPLHTGLYQLPGDGWVFEALGEYLQVIRSLEEHIIIIGECAEDLAVSNRIKLSKSLKLGHK